MNRTTIALLAVAAGLTTASDAQIEYLDQSRFVEVYGFLPGEDVTISDAPQGFGQFDRTLNEVLSNADGSVWAYASQVSMLGSGGMTASGAADGSSGPPAGSSAGVGRSGFSVDFRLAQSVEYTLDLAVFSEFASYSFQGPGLTVDRAFDFAVGDPGLQLTGVLGPGDYSFSILIESGAAAEGLGSNFDFSFVVVPAPGIAGLLAMGTLATTRRRR